MKYFEITFAFTSGMFYVYFLVFFFFSLIVLFYYIEKMLIQYRYGLGGLLTQDQTSDIGDRTQCHSAGIGPP